MGKSSKSSSNKTGKAVSLQQVLFTQGFGTRRECDALIVSGMVQVGNQVCDDPDACFVLEGLAFRVRDEAWVAREKALILLNKPAGYECSQKPRDWPSVLSLLPSPLRLRSGDGVQPVGRLDADTTGLLLLTDDGALIHRLTSPKKLTDKVYRVSLSEDLNARQLQLLAQTMVLEGEAKPVQAKTVQQVSERQLLLTLTEGKYHQVKRMVAAAGNHVVALHREQLGEWKLPDDLKPGQWIWVQQQGHL
jgi:16S rRNA pseudouridine516 synthase